MPELAHFPAYVRTGCVRTYAAIDPKHAYRRDKRKRQGTTAMVVPCLCSFLLTVLSSASAGTCRGAAPPSCAVRKTVLSLAHPTGVCIVEHHSTNANLISSSKRLCFNFLLCISLLYLYFRFHIHHVLI